MNISRTFFTSWLSVIKRRESEVLKLWDTPRDFTKLIIHSGDSILLNIGSEIGYECYNADYYYTDAVFYKPKDVFPDYPKAYYLTDIRIAFEHENDFKSGLFQEVCHLLQVNSKLKVLVAYPPNKEEELEELDYLHRVILRSESSNELSEKETFLIIMGHAEPYSWSGWLFNTECWVKI